MAAVEGGEGRVAWAVVVVRVLGVAKEARRGVVEAVGMVEMAGPMGLAAVKVAG